MTPRAALSLLALLPALSSCDKEGVDALPKATQKGLNTMGCLLDGTAWLPYRNAARQGGTLPPMVAYWRRHDQGRISLTMLFMRDREPQRFASSISFYAPTITGPVTLALNQLARPSATSANPAYGLFSNEDETPDLDYLTGPAATGELVITRFDTIARVASGTFSFTGRADDGRTVAVSQGRFDVQLERR